MDEGLNEALDEEYCIFVKELYRLILKEENERLTEEEQKQYKILNKAISKNIKSYSTFLKK